MFPSWWEDESLLIVIDVGIDESKSGSLLAPNETIDSQAITNWAPRLGLPEESWFDGFRIDVNAL
jgi:hypothetical protein